MKYTDLSYLESISDGSKELIKEMIDIFISQINEYTEEMYTLWKNKDWDELGKLAHKAKSSVAIMGMNELANELKTLEFLAKEEKEVEKYLEIINKFKTECNQAVTELKDLSFKLP